MKLTSILVLAAILPVSMASAQSAAPSTGTPTSQGSEASLRQLLAALDPIEKRAEIARDIPLLRQLAAAMAAPGFTYTRPNGQSLNFKQTQAWFQSREARIKTVSNYSFTIISMQPISAGVVVAARKTISGTALNRQNAVQPFAASSAVKELWVMQNSGWKLLREVAYGNAGTSGNGVGTGQTGVSPLTATTAQQTSGVQALTQSSRQTTPTLSRGPTLQELSVSAHQAGHSILPTGQRRVISPQRTLARQAPARQSAKAPAQTQ